MSLELLTSTVARHFETATVAGARVDLGFADLTITCELSATPPVANIQSAQMLLTLAGGPWPEPVDFAMVGYGPTIEAAIEMGACTWCCTFAPVLESALTGELAGNVQAVELAVPGGRMIGYLDTLDTVLHFEAGAEQTGAARERLGVAPWVLPNLLGSLAADDLPRKQLIVASVFIGEIGSRRIAELRVDGKPFGFDDEMFAGAKPPPAHQLVSLRELAILLRFDDPPPA